MTFYDARILPGGSPSSWSLSCEIQGGREGAAATLTATATATPASTRQPVSSSKRPSEGLAEGDGEAKKLKSDGASAPSLPIHTGVNSSPPASMDGHHRLIDAAMMVTCANLGPLKNALPVFPARQPAADAVTLNT